LPGLEKNGIAAQKEDFLGSFFGDITLLFMGHGISLSTLQDTRKTQNKVSKQIWEHPTKGKVALAFMSGTTLFFILFGLYYYFAVDQNVLKELSFGMIVLGIGLIGLLKAAIEMFENHRLDKKIQLLKGANLLYHHDLF